FLQNQVKTDFQTPGWVLFWGALVGVFAGTATVLYRTAVIWGNNLIWGEEGANLEQSMVQLFFPAIGGLLVGLILYKFLRATPDHGVPSVIHAVQTNRIQVPWRVSVPSALSVIVLASGGSAGPEGPAAEIGAVFGSNTGRFFKASPKTLRTLVGCGVAAAISAVFSAPIAGVFFAVEVIFQGFALTQVPPVIMAAVTASIIAQIELGYGPAIALTKFDFELFEFPLYVGLGILTGIVSVAFVKWLDLISNFFKRLKTPLWLKPALGGLGVGAISLLTPDVVGEGYTFLERTLAGEGEIVLSALVLVFLGKILATGFTLGSGAPGGSFAPAMFIGGTLGGIYGILIELIAPQVTSFSNYALLGMAGMVVGTFNAPITAIMIILQVTQMNPRVLLPLMTIVAVVHFTMSRWENVSVYTQVLKRQGKWLPPDYDKDPLLHIPVADVLAPAKIRFQESAKVDEVIERMGDTDEAAFAVEDEEGEFRGIITLHALRGALADPLMGRLVTLSDVIDDSLPSVSPLMSLREVIHEFENTSAEALPVFDDEGFAGLVTREGVIGAYREARIAMEHHAH
ncbi:MAG: chloride channel protein, partial [Candidatus Omnitrophica bacterium]|nr:chloride channel protein [Candidatus Omnitrophota bacterium]